MSKLSALAKLRSQKKSNEGNKSVDILNRLTGDSPTPISRESIPRKLIIKENKPEPEINEVKEIPTKSIPNDTPKRKLDIDYSLSVDTSLMVEAKVYHETQKRHKINPSLYRLITNELDIETVKKNFSKESPDDKIENAQKQAFNQNFKNLTVDEKPKEVKVKDQKKIDTSKISKIYSKPHKSFVVIGHVDAGKSTLMGRILLDLGIVDIKTLNKLIKESESIGKGSFALAWVMDQTSEERARGVTIDIVSTNFETSKTRFTAIDAPGHKDFVPQMINGVCQSDFALLIVDSITGEFESGFNSSGQTKEHTIIARNSGVEKLCVVVNKLDKENWSEHRFEFIVDTMKDYLINEIGYEESQIDFIPLSGLSGNNVIKRESIDDFNWYKGPSLIEYLEDIEISTSTTDEITKEPFNLVINDIIEATNEVQIIGKIISGSISNGDAIKILPLDQTLKITKLKNDGKTVEFGIKGEIVELSVNKKQLENLDDVVIGDIITNSTKVETVETFECELSLFNLTKPLLIGTPFILFRSNFNLPCKLTKIVSTNGRKRKHLISNQQAVVQITIDSNRLLPLCKFDDDPILGKVVIRKEGTTIGAGKITKLSDA
ncbi:elongation factor 1 alpha-like protein [[Candida] jaroonii]|uniref:Elongation factor 1 alpha-like protein n=1 Tax=[Candida] jaroonii TaxID=467808 RepID=A0ACA9Y2S8_9ASCO|nr:elongation factor 1 alpha-like protein [[Candida] jaroonii]